MKRLTNILGLLTDCEKVRAGSDLRYSLAWSVFVDEGKLTR